MPRVYGSDGAAVGQLFHAIDALGKSGVADDVFSRGQIKEGLLRGAPRGAVAARATAPRAAAAAVPHVGGGGGAAATCNNVGPYLLKGAVLASHDSHTRGACCELCTRSNQCSGVRHMRLVATAFSSFISPHTHPRAHSLTPTPLLLPPPPAQYTFEQMSDVCTLVSGQLIIDFEVEQKGIVSGSVVGREFGMDHDAAKDCAMIGMAAAHCNPTIAKVFAHTQFPANGCAGGITPIPVRQDCGEGPTMYESWATNGFGSDNRVFLPSIMSAAIELRRPAVFMTPRGREWQSIFWLFNKKSNANVVVEDDFCPHKTYYDCYFKPATTCALDARCPASAVDNYRAFECQPEEFIKPANDLTAFLQKQPGGVCGSSERADGAGRRATTRPPTQKEIDTVKAIAAKALTAEGMKGGGPYEIHTAALFFQLNTKMQGYVADQKRKIGFTGKRIGVQIRHSDFVIEHPETRVETYCIIVARMMELSGINGIYLATDDPQITPQSFTKCVVKAGRAVLQIKLDASKISVVSQKWKRGVGSTEDQAARNGANAFALAALTDLILLGDCDALVISGGSSFSHLSMVLAVTKGRAKHFHVVDCAGADVKELVALRQLEAKLAKHDAAKGGVSWQLADARKDIEVLTGESALLNMLELANFHNYYSPKSGIDAW